MLSKKMEKALNEQINKEMFSAYIYLSMATFLAEKRYDGMASFMQVQAQEELEHAMKIYGFVEERGGRVLLDAIAKPDSDFQNPLKVFETALGHEKFISKSINDLVDLAIAEKDHATKEFLAWFVKEQVEEEANMDRIVGQMQMIGDHGHGLFMLDRHLGERKAD
ncbi:MAG TPA: ferritin [bacterium]|nr:ferritin [bacterium]HNT64439.1 ferritin [bacterium]HOX84714.1 ferritin [bacterium]HPG45437.1 ferritin [bacterium]HPM96787.1 ferritin [bacterium]